MNYKIKVNRLRKEDSNLKGFATVVFGECFKVTNIAILDGKNGLYVQMPRYRTNELDENNKNVYKDFCNPTTKEFREDLYGNILETYESQEFDEMYVGYRKDETPDKIDYDVKVTPFEREGSSIKGLARIYLNDEFIVNNISILSGKNSEFVTMPSYKTSGGNYQDVCYPITKDFREELYETILKQYVGAKNKNVMEKVPGIKQAEPEKKDKEKAGKATKQKSKENDQEKESPEKPKKR